MKAVAGDRHSKGAGSESPGRSTLHYSTAAERLWSAARLLALGSAVLGAYLPFMSTHHRLPAYARLARSGLPWTLGRLPLLAFFAVGLISALSIAGQDVPLVNPGFEDATADGRQPAGWELSEWTGGATDIVLEQTADGLDGSHAARVTWRSGGNNILLHQTIPLAGQQRCRLTFVYRTDGQSGVSCSIRTLAGDRALQYNSSPSTEANTDWTAHTFEFTTHPSTEQLVVYLRQRGGTVWYDNVSLARIPLPAPIERRSAAAVAAWERFAPGTVRRNNLVMQLLDVEAVQPDPKGGPAQDFATPRDGWIHVVVTAPHRAPEALRVRLDTAQDVPLRPRRDGDRESSEAMLFVPAGAHSARLYAPEPAAPVRLTICAIPELICCEVESAASGREQLMRRHPDLLQDYNVTLENFFRHQQDDPSRTETIDPASQQRLQQWLAQGGRALTHSQIPGLDADSPIPLRDAAQFWARAAGFDSLHGIMCDEFGHETPEQLAVYRAAIETLSTDPRYAGKTFYAYAPPAWGSGAENRAFRETLFRYGHKQALELYLREASTAAEADRELADTITQWLGSAELDMPGSLAQTVAVLCCCSGATYGMDCYASVDFRVFLDLQVRLLATEPACAGLGGLSWWILRYADDDIIRWLGRLHRHYAIEGQRESLAAQLGLTYRLPHLRNPDFVAGLQDWRVETAPGGRVEARRIAGFGRARGTMRPAPVGDDVVAMERVGPQPNRISQDLRDLLPGSLYLVTLYSAATDPTGAAAPENRLHGLCVSVSGADLLPERATREVYNQAYDGVRLQDGRTWFNRHTWTFRAPAATAEFAITDADPDGQPRHDRQSLLFNFVEVRRLLE
jgi:hypothetical protein